MHMGTRNYRNNITNGSNRPFSSSEMPTTAFYSGEDAKMYDYSKDNLFYRYTSWEVPESYLS